MGFADAFAYAGPAEIFAEHAALSGFENDGTRALDISDLAGLDAADYDRLPPVQWPRASGASQQRLFADGGFLTPDRKARFVGDAGGRRRERRRCDHRR